MAIQEFPIQPPEITDSALRDAVQWAAPATRPPQPDVASGSVRAVPIDVDKTGDDLVRLVLAVVETVRQLIEKQAIRRVESGTLSDEEVERLGLALIRLDERMTELKEHFELADDDLALKLGPFNDFIDEVRNE